MGLILIHAAHEVVQIKVFWILQACGLGQFKQRVQRVVVKVFDAFSLGLHHQGHLALGILGGHTRGAVSSVAGLCLNAANGEHEATCAVAPIRTKRQSSGDIKGGDDFPAGAQFDAVSQIQAHQGVVDQSQALLHGRTHVVGEL